MESYKKKSSNPFMKFFVLLIVLCAFFSFVKVHIFIDIILCNHWFWID